MREEPVADVEELAGRASPRKRADARRNEQTLLDAAADVFVASGVDAPVRDIAARAGVGMGTIYRHFPTRAELVIAVYQHQVEACAEAGPALLASSPTPHAALTRWAGLFVDFLVTKHGLARALQSDKARFETLHAYFLNRLVPVCAQLLDAARAAGQIHSDVDAYALLFAIGNLCAGAGADSRYDARDMVGLLIAGLLQPPVQELPASPRIRAAVTAELGQRSCLPNQCLVAPNGSPLAWANTLTGMTENTLASPVPSEPRKQPSRAVNCQRPSHFGANAAATRSSTASSATRTASPSTTTSSPRSHRLHPVVSTTCGLASKLACFCSSAPVENHTAPSDQAATTGVTCGRPSARTVEIQNSSAVSSTLRVSSQVVATAAGSLYSSSNVVTGAGMAFLLSH
jgi:AcrR family transcriptional regulator